MGLEDAVGVAGNMLLGLGTPSRKYTSPLATGVSTAIATAGRAFEKRKERKAEQKTLADRATIESKLGIPYEFFLKLSDEAQNDILKRVGITQGQAPIEAFGGRTMTQLETEGAPARESTVPGGSGVFLGLPDATVQTGPPLPPLKALSSKGKDAAVNRYIGLGGDEPDISAKDQSLIDYRKGRLDQGQQSLESRLATDRERRKQIQASTAALKALKINREKPDSTVPAYMLDVARQMGVTIPKGQVVTRKDYDTLVSKFPKPVMAVVSRITDLAYAARDAELARGTSLSDKEIEAAVRNGTIGLDVIAKDPAAIGIVVSGVKRELRNLRAIPDLVKKDGGTEPSGTEDADENGIPDLLEGDDEDYTEEDDSEPR